MNLLADCSSDILACAEPVTVTRFSAPQMVKGRARGPTPSLKLRAQLVVYPLNDAQLQRLPEGMRREGAVGFVTPTRLRTVRTSQCKTPDEFEHNGTRYQVSQVKDWSSLGNFYEGVATRLDR